MCAPNNDARSLPLIIRNTRRAFPLGFASLVIPSDYIIAQFDGKKDHETWPAGEKVTSASFVEELFSSTDTVFLSCARKFLWCVPWTIARKQTSITHHSNCLSDCRCCDLFIISSFALLQKETLHPPAMLITSAGMKVYATAVGHKSHHQHGGHVAANIALGVIYSWIFFNSLDRYRETTCAELIRQILGLHPQLECAADKMALYEKTWQSGKTSRGTFSPAFHSLDYRSGRGLSLRNAPFLWEGGFQDWPQVIWFLLRLLVTVLLCSQLVYVDWTTQSALSSLPSSGSMPAKRNPLVPNPWCSRRVRMETFRYERCTPVPSLASDLTLFVFHSGKSSHWPSWPASSEYWTAKRPTTNLKSARNTNGSATRCGTLCNDWVRLKVSTNNNSRSLNRPFFDTV